MIELLKVSYTSTLWGVALKTIVKQVLSGVVSKKIIL